MTFTREQIIEWACEVHPDWFYPDPALCGEEVEFLERFAALVAAAEREACARIAWNHEPDDNGPIEAAIRARRNHD